MNLPDKRMLTLFGELEFLSLELRSSVNDLCGNRTRELTFKPELKDSECFKDASEVIDLLDKADKKLTEYLEKYSSDIHHVY